MRYWLNLMVCLLVGTQLSAQTDSLKTDSVIADTSRWKISGLSALNFSQIALKNWNGGGQSAVSGTGIISINANYKGKKSSFNNTLNFAYGLQKQEIDGVRKTDDKIDLLSQYGQFAFGKWYYSALVNLRSQFAPGFNYPNDSVKISNFFAPAFITASLGLENKIKDNFTVYIAPITAKYTLVNDKQLSATGAFGVDSNKVLRQEYGGSFRMIFSLKIMENVDFASSIDLFSNYSEKPKNIDVNWSNLLSFKVNKFISASITTNLIYDDDIIIKADKNNDGEFEVNGPRTQFKEVLSLGLQYQF